MHVPEGFHISAAQFADVGFVKVTWSHKLRHSDTGQASCCSGWLYQTGPYGDADFEADFHLGSGLQKPSQIFPGLMAAALWIMRMNISAF